jgi:SET domain-containing protein
MPPRPLPRLVRRRSRISGWGVFAAETINKNRRIIDYAGELISQKESARREKISLPQGRIWCFNIDRRWVRDGSVGGNVARFINHACRANCYAEIAGRTIWIRAAKTIEAGQELTYDYSTGGAAGIACRCRPGCDTII